MAVAVAVVLWLAVAVKSVVLGRTEKVAVKVVAVVAHPMVVRA